MSPDFFNKWEHILEDVEKSRIPIQFLKKLVIKLKGKKQHTINIITLLKQGLDPEQIEDVVNKKLYELDDDITNIEFILNVESIADAVQPETDRLLSGL
jgi:hypothetical protein